MLKRIGKLFILVLATMVVSICLAIGVSANDKLPNDITTGESEYIYEYAPFGTFRLEATCRTRLLYESIDPTVVTVDTDGTVVIHDVGNTFIRIYTTGDDTYLESEKVVPVTITKGTPSPNVAATPVIYGQDIAASVLMVDEGHASWENLVSAFKVPGKYTYSAVYTPADTDHYKSARFPVTITVERAPLRLANDNSCIVQTPYGENASYNEDARSIVSAITGDVVTGTYSYSSENYICDWLGASEHTNTFTFFPLQSDLYMPYYGTVQMIGIKGDIHVVTTTVTGTAGQTLSSIPNSTITVVNASGQPVQFTLHWATPNAILEVGETDYAATIQPTATAFYNPIEVIFTVSTTKQKVELTSIHIDHLTYGTKLKDLSFAYSTNVPTTYTVYNGESMPTAGEHQIAIEFTPTDPSTATATVVYQDIVVDKADPIVSDTYTEQHVYGTKISDIVLHSTVMFKGYQYDAVYRWDSRYTSTYIPSVGESLTAYICATDTNNFNWIEVEVVPTLMRASWPYPIDVGVCQLGESLSKVTIKSYGAICHWLDPDRIPSLTDSETTEFEFRVDPLPEYGVNYKGYTGTKKIKVVKLTPEVGALQATPIEFGQTLADSIITGYKYTAGHYEWVDPDHIPTMAESETAVFPVKFISDDPNFSDMMLDGTTVKVNKRVLDPSKFNNMFADTITYGQSLRNATIHGSVLDVSFHDGSSGQTRIDGVFAYEEPDIIPPVSSNDSGDVYPCMFIPSTEGYGIVTGLKVNVKVIKSPIVFSDEEYASILADPVLYPNPLSSSTIKSTVRIPGSFVWADPDIIPNPEDGRIQVFVANYIPSDPGYEPKYGINIPVTVMKPIDAETDFSSVEALPVMYGTKLSEVTIVWDELMPGVFEFKLPDYIPTVDDTTNEKEFEMTFIPDDDRIAITTGIKVKVKVQPIKVPFEVSATEPTATGTPIAFGQSLEDSELMGTAPIAGSFRWSNPSTVPMLADSDTKLFPILFCPTSNNYVETGGIFATLTVNPRVFEPSAFTNLKSTVVTAGETLSSSKITGDAPIAGQFEWAYPTTLPKLADSNVTKWDVIFKPEDNQNYTDVYLRQALAVEVVNPPAEISTEMRKTIMASPIVYGQPLSASTISGDTPCAGHYEFQKPDHVPTIDEAAQQTYPVVFISEDRNFSNTYGLSVKVVVKKKAFTIGDFKFSYRSLTYGEPLSEAKITVVGPVEGTCAWKDPAAVPTVRQSKTELFTMIWTPKDTKCYETLQFDARVIVNKAIPVLTEGKGSAITYGDTLSESKIGGATATNPISASVKCEGTFAWANSSIMPTPLDSDKTLFEIIFTPKDTDNYYGVYGKATVTVSKAKPYLQVYGSAVTVNGNPGRIGIYTNSNGRITFTADQNAPFTVTSYGTVYGEHIGKGKVKVEIAESAYYEAASGEAEVIVNGKLASLLGETTYTVMEGDPDFNLEIKANLNNPNIAYTIVDGISVSVNNKGDVHIKHFGETTIRVAVVNPGYDSEEMLVKVIVEPFQSHIEPLSDLVMSYNGKAQTIDAKSNSHGTWSYSTDNSAVASVHKNIITPGEVGTAVITVRLKEGSKELAATSFMVTVEQAESKVVDIPKITIKDNAKPFVLKDGIQNKDARTYTVSNASVVSVDYRGTVTPISAGTATITVSTAGGGNYKAASQTIDITVKSTAVETTSGGGGYYDPYVTQSATGGGYIDPYITQSTTGGGYINPVQTTKATEDTYTYNPYTTQDTSEVVVVDDSTPSGTGAQIIVPPPDSTFTGDYVNTDESYGTVYIPPPIDWDNSIWYSEDDITHDDTLNIPSYIATTAEFSDEVPVDTTTAIEVETTDLGEDQFEGVRPGDFEPEEQSIIDRILDFLKTNVLIIIIVGVALVGGVITIIVIASKKHK